MDISLYGGTGFVGSWFERASDECDNIYLIPKWKRKPQPNTDLLYMISTTHNYNVFKDASIDVDTNLRVLTETLDSWRHNNPESTFNFVSSWFVYGELQNPAYEDCICRPKGFYSITKYCAEQLVQSYADTFNLKYRILRLANVTGKKEASPQENALQYLINEMKAGRSVSLYDGGNFYRNYITVYDCVDAIRLVMDKGELNSIYNVGNKNYCFADLIYNAAHKLHCKPEKVLFTEQADFHKKVQTKSFKMNTDKLKKLGFQPYFNTIDEIVSTLL
jgi:nucleoside-diphosphate-sugar epimerase